MPRLATRQHTEAVLWALLRGDTLPMIAAATGIARSMIPHWCSRLHDLADRGVFGAYRPPAHMPQSSRQIVPALVSIGYKVYQLADALDLVRGVKPRRPPVDTFRNWGIRHRMDLPAEQLEALAIRAIAMNQPAVGVDCLRQLMGIARKTKDVPTLKRIGVELEALLTRSEKSKTPNGQKAKARMLKLQAEVLAALTFLHGVTQQTEQAVEKIEAAKPVVEPPKPQVNYDDKTTEELDALLEQMRREETV